MLQGVCLRDRCKEGSPFCHVLWAMKAVRWAPLTSGTELVPPDAQEEEEYDRCDEGDAVGRWGVSGGTNSDGAALSDGIWAKSLKGEGETGSQATGEECSRQKRKKGKSRKWA